ncbi:MAG TPA: phospholipid carrier-dependent glycosyltransferase, partial [bacterium]|nr:phospholipid carrier-dependent glycosyltransferase [bacterium]
MTPQPRPSYGLFFVTLLGMALAGSLMIWIATGPWGMGTNTDSANYIAGARNMLAGHGYSNFASRSPITHWPPFLSFSLAIIGLLGIDPLEGARPLNSALFGLNLLLVGFILLKLTGSAWAALAGAFFMITSKSMLIIHTWVCSEPWFIFFSFISLFLLTRFLKENRFQFFILSAILAALACLDRYAGLSVIAAGVILILFFYSDDFWRRVKAALLYFTISFIPPALWMIRNHVLKNDPVGRKFYLQSLSPNYFRDILDTVSQWILPASIPASWRYAVLLGFCFVLGAAIAALLRRKTNGQSFKIPASSSAFIFISSLVIFSTCVLILHLSLHLFVNASVRADHRHFSPVFVAGLLSLIILTQRFLKI